MGAFLARAFGPFKGWFGNVTTLVIPIAVVTGVAIHHPVLAALIGVGVIAALFLGAGVRTQLEWDKAVAKWKATQPRIVIGAVWGGTMVPARTDHIARKGTGEYVGARQHILPDAEVIGVAIQNEPPGHNPDAVVTDALVRLAFYSNDSDSEAIETQGRWTDNPQAITRPLGAPTDDLKRRTLRPNGEWNRVAVALHHSDDNSVYAEGDHIWAGERTIKDDRFRLKPSTYRVRVAVSGTHLATEEVRWFVLTVPEAAELMSPEPE